MIGSPAGSVGISHGMNSLKGISGGSIINGIVHSFPFAVRVLNKFAIVYVRDTLLRVFGDVV